MTEKPNSGRKRDGISPEELWKRVSQQLSSKKYEADSRAAYSTLYDFSEVSRDMTQSTKQRMLESEEKEFYRREMVNSILAAPLPRELESQNPPTAETQTPHFFPNHPLYHFRDPNFYKRLDLDTLFFIFYYQKGTVHQTYAAIQLKHYAWRFHLKYKMWFQRLDEPKLITTDYEKGEFLFFDYETTWNFMKKNDFVFEYYYLEHNDHF